MSRTAHALLIESALRRCYFDASVATPHAWSGLLLSHFRGASRQSSRPSESDRISASRCRTGVGPKRASPIENPTSVCLTGVSLRAVKNCGGK